MPTHTYYHTGYGADLQRVLSKSHDGRSISICSFLPDYPDDPVFREPAEAIQSLPDARAFIVAVFWDVLVDQAAYGVHGREIERSVTRPGPPRLVGLLSTFNSYVHPGFLLFALSFRRSGYRNRAFLVGELEGAGRECLTEASTYLGQTWPIVADRMLDALTPQSLPDSIRAYVPHGDGYRLRPDMGVIDSLTSTAQNVIRASANASDRR